VANIRRDEQASGSSDRRNLLARCYGRSSPIKPNHDLLGRLVAEQQFVRFLLVGGLNTLMTYIIYMSLVFCVSYSTAYTITYVLGIFISCYLNSQFVFKKKLRLVVALQYPVVYAGTLEQVGRASLNCLRDCANDLSC
jgi:GtrA-like protein